MQFPYQPAKPFFELIEKNPPIQSNTHLAEEYLTVPEEHLSLQHPTPTRCFVRRKLSTNLISSTVIQQLGTARFSSKIPSFLCLRLGIDKVPRGSYVSGKTTHAPDRSPRHISTTATATIAVYTYPLHSLTAILSPLRHLHADHPDSLIPPMSGIQHATTRHSPPHVRKSASFKTARSTSAAKNSAASLKITIGGSKKAKKEKAELLDSYEDDDYMATTFLQYW